MSSFKQVTYIDAPIELVFNFHLDLNNLLRISPEEANLQIFHAPQKIEEGAKVGLFVKFGPVTTTMETVIERLVPPNLFVDKQVGGFFEKWIHTHKFEAITSSKTKLTDTIEYTMPMGIFGKVFGGGIAHSKIESIFRHRAKMTKQILEDEHKKSSDQN